MIQTTPELRFSGHESFVLRVGWLRKYYDAATLTPEILSTDEAAITGLGIGRNMVKSLEFWADAADVVHRSGGGFAPGMLGTLLFHPEHGVDPYMEGVDAVALVHWWLSSNANLAAWEVVFGSKALNRFTRRQLAERVTAKASGAKRTLSPTTIDQHVSILLASYSPLQGSDEQAGETTHCPLHELELLRRVQGVGTEELFEVSTQDRLLLQARTFGRILAQFWFAQYPKAESIPFDAVLNGIKSPGAVFRLTAYALETALVALEEGSKGAFRLIDTADTRRISVTSLDVLKGWAGS